VSPTHIVEGEATQDASVIPLVREYTEKLDELSERLRSLWDRWNGTAQKDRIPAWQLEGAAVRQHYHDLRRGVQDLARYASGLIEHGKLLPSQRAELKVRLVELEATLKSTVTKVNAYNF
jgi:hypothetical protein